MLLKRKKKAKISKLDVTLKNYLSYMLDNVDKFSNELSHEYSPYERREFVYNCTINTVLEFIQKGRSFIIPQISTVQIIQDFKNNYMLRIFYEPEIKPNMSGVTQEIVKKFEALKLNLSATDKNDVMSSVNKLITSTI
ncbi:MAG: hypothetical protein J6A15_08225 [Clostridia bacterium]|nr:hypothetical protein [Clostridia bacterium]